jgi:hypothetical protein
MAHLFQVGAGSGGMPVLDLVCRDPRVSHVTLIEPDVHKPRNVHRHLFGLCDVGMPKGELARLWLLQRRPDLQVSVLSCDLTDAGRQDELHSIVASADVGICAADNERAKYHFDSLMRAHGKPWALGEVLSGGIGGLVHVFAPGGPCYGCVASRLYREPSIEPPPPDYAAPGGPVWETSIPASMAAIHAIAALHALAVLDLLQEKYPPTPTMLFPLQRVPGVFSEAYRPVRVSARREKNCLSCHARPGPAYAEELDAALDEALARLA